MTDERDYALPEIPDYREWYYEHGGTRADYDAWVKPMYALRDGVEHVLSAYPQATPFYSADGIEALILLSGPYIIKVDDHGNTFSACLTTVSTGIIADVMNKNEADVTGWTAAPDLTAETWAVEGKDGFELDADYYPLSEHPDYPQALTAARVRLAELNRTQPDAGGQGGIQDRVYIVHPGGRRERIFS